MINEIQKLRLRKFVKELKSYQASHTEFVSVYIPQNYEMNKIISHLYQELGTAENIKSASTRKNVKAALEKMIQFLKTYFPRTPENGLAIFSGNILAKEGRSDVRVWAIEPPLPLKMRLYRCDKQFVLDILEEMLMEKKVFGLIVIDRREATIGLLKGKNILVLAKVSSPVPGKVKAGGQSARRYERVTEGLVRDHFKKVGEIAKEQFFDLAELEGILLGGPGPTKEDFLKGDFLPEALKRKVITVKDLSYTSEEGLEELVNKSEDALKEESILKEKKEIQMFFDLLAKKPELTAYGKEEVLGALSLGAVEKVLLSEELSDWLEEIEEEANRFNTEIIVISTQTREGEQLKNLGGIAAVLRFKIAND